MEKKIDETKLFEAKSDLEEYLLEKGISIFDVLNSDEVDDPEESE